MQKSGVRMDFRGLVPAQVASAQDHVCGVGPYRQIFAQIRGRFGCGKHSMENVGCLNRV